MEMTQPAGPSLDQIKRFDRAFFGHPLGLLVLSMNEIWERFSFYGMKAILILYMVADASSGGMGMPYAEAAAVYGLYSCLGATLILPGGWVADMLWGQRKALLIGGIVITFGHMSMAITSTACFYIGMGLIIVGTGLLKPSSTIMVSQLYPPNDPRQDAGYTIYYMCINVGALLGPLVCGYLGQAVSWHAGFSAAGFGMVIGVIVYVAGYRVLGPVGLPSAITRDPAASRRNSTKLFIGMGVVGLITALLIFGNTSGTFVFTFGQLARVLGFFLVLLPIIYFAVLFRSGRWTVVERNHLIVIVTLFFFSIFYWAAADQRGSLFMFFADEVTNCTIGSWTFPSTWFTAVNPALIIILTPFFAWLWPALGKNNPSTPAKFAWAMFFASASFAVMVGAAFAAGPERDRVGPEWLLVNILLITIGEMFLSPVGISAFARLAPQNVASQVMGVWFLRGSLAGLLASFAGSAYETSPLEINFGVSMVVLLVAGVALVIATPVIKRLIDSKPEEGSFRS